jgi:hypothetical protein
MKEEIVGKEFLGVFIQDPFTGITNLMLATSCVIFANRIKQKAPNQKHWRYFFLAIALAFVCGAVDHSFRYIYEEKLAQFSRMFGLIPLLFVQLSANQLMSSYKLKTLNTIASVSINIIAAFGFILYLLGFYQSFNTFFIYISVAIISFIVILLPSHYNFSKGKNFKYLKYFGIGILSMLIPLSAFVFKIGINKWVTQNDIAHLTLIISLLLIAKSIIIMDKEISPFIIKN